MRDAVLEEIIKRNRNKGLQEAPYPTGTRSTNDNKVVLGYATNRDVILDVLMLHRRTDKSTLGTERGERGNLAKI